MRNSGEQERAVDHARPERSRSSLDELVRRCRTLQERLGGTGAVGWPPGRSGVDEAFLRQWGNLLGGQGLERRLAWLGLERCGADGLAARPTPVTRRNPETGTTESRGEWELTLAELIQVTADAFVRADHGGPSSAVPPELSPVDPSAQLPFEDLLLPAVGLGLRRLRRSRDGEEPPGLSRLSPTALKDLLRFLLVELVTIASPLLHSLFTETRPVGQNLLLATRRQVPRRSGRRLYADFIGRQGRNGLLILLNEYPMLGRMLAVRVDSWAASVTELVDRLDADWDELLRCFDVEGRRSGRVAMVDCGLSDFHGGGRSVLILILDSGARVVYKPRDPSLHQALAELLDWIETIGGARLKTARLLARPDYAWVEHLASRPCADPQEAGRFYENAGALLCVVYLLGGTDCHCGNLLACGDQPVLIDTETVVHARLGAETVADDPETDERRIADSVIRTGLLPSWEFSPDRRTAFDISGLGSHEVPELLQQSWQWLAVNTDDMHYRLAACGPPSRRNIPTLDGERLNVGEYLAELQRGFSKTYRALQRSRELLLDEHGPLQRFRGCNSRFVFRPTNVYSGLLNRCCAPDACRDGLAWSLQLEQLARAVTMEDRRRPLTALLEAELGAMADLDVPCFTTPVEGGAVVPLDGRPLPGLHSRSALAAIRRRVRALCETDLEFQLELIRGSCAALTSAGVRLDADPLPQTVDGSSSILEHQVALAQARRLADSLAERALLQGKHARWLGFRYSAETERLQLGLVPHGLYDGRCGIALFLATLDSVCGQSRFRPLWQAALRPLAHWIDPASPERGRLVRAGLGLSSGVGGVLYSLVRLAAISASDERARLLDLASKFAALVTPERVGRDETLDLLGGCAGAIIGLLSLHRATGKERHLEQALWCGKHLLHARAGTASQATSGNARPLTGFSHGASGIAFALCRLAGVCDTDEFDEALNAALDYETRAFDKRERNWLDLRWMADGESPPAFQTSWCHGAPGIALTRLALLGDGEDARLEEELSVALETTASIGLLPTDNLCCGNLGLSDVLLTSGVWRARPELCRSASELAARVVERALRDQGYRLLGGFPDPLFSPGLFQGAAGIGYQLLRLAFPTQVPSVLMFGEGADHD